MKFFNIKPHSKILGYSKLLKLAKINTRILKFIMKLLQVLDKYSPADHYLPESYTCFFLLKIPRYSCKPVLAEKLRYAIYFCKSIDTDDYARVNLRDGLLDFDGDIT